MQQLPTNFGCTSITTMTTARKEDERVYPGQGLPRVIADSLAHYEFASHYVRGLDVLDVGCGEGYGVQALQSAGAKSIVGIDIDSEIVALAKKNHPALIFMVDDAVQTKFPNNKFDIIVCFDVWHQLDRHKLFLDEMLRLLKPGGLLIASVPSGRVMYLHPLHRGMKTAYYRKNFDRKILENELAGKFSSVQYFGQRFVPRPYSWAVTKVIFIFLSKISSKVKNRIEIAYRRGDGPRVRPLLYDNARLITFVGKK